MVLNPHQQKIAIVLALMSPKGSERVSEKTSVDGILDRKTRLVGAKRAWSDARGWRERSGREAQ